MSASGLVIFDGDDTLWAVEHLYDRALAEAASAVSAAGLPAEEWVSLQREIDLRNVKKMGVSPERFPLSSVQAVVELADRHAITPTDQLRETVDRASRSVFLMKAPIVDSAASTLSALSSHYCLALLTKGDEAIQQRRVETSGLAAWFDRIDIVADKNEEVFTLIVDLCGFSPHRSWSVGNSLASDVYPALRAGLNAIWIDAHVWEHERREGFSAHPRLQTLEHFEDVVPLLLPATVAPRH
jgi:putative hydrolase of the HAD superfamily